MVESFYIRYILYPLARICVTDIPPLMIDLWSGVSHSVVVLNAHARPKLQKQAGGTFVRRTFVIANH